MSTQSSSDRSVRKLANLIRRQKLVETSVIDKVLADAAGLNVDLPFVLAKRGIISEEKMANGISKALQIPLVSQVETETVRLDIPFFSIEQMERFRCIPTAVITTGALPRIRLAMSNPFVLEQMNSFTGRATFDPCVSPASVIRNAIHTLRKSYGVGQQSQAILDTLINAGFVTPAQLNWAKETVFNLYGGKHSEGAGSNSKTGEDSS